MFKKCLIFIVALMIASPAIAATPQGTISGGKITSGAGDEEALPIVTFGCNDPKYGEFDLCIDMVFSMLRPKANVRMATNINPKLAASHKRVLMRYTFMRSPMSAGSTFQSVQVFDERNILGITAQTYQMRQAVVARMSNDGGTSWSKMNVDYR